MRASVVAAIVLAAAAYCPLMRATPTTSDAYNPRSSGATVVAASPGNITGTHTFTRHPALQTPSRATAGFEQAKGYIFELDNDSEAAASSDAQVKQQGKNAEAPESLVAPKEFSGGTTPWFSPAPLKPAVYSSMTTLVSPVTTSAALASTVRSRQSWSHSTPHLRTPRRAEHRAPSRAALSSRSYGTNSAADTGVNDDGDATDDSAISKSWLSMFQAEQASLDPCEDERGEARRCIPDFENAAFRRVVTASSTCGRPAVRLCQLVSSPTPSKASLINRSNSTKVSSNHATDGAASAVAAREELKLENATGDRLRTATKKAPAAGRTVAYDADIDNSGEVDTLQASKEPIDDEPLHTCQMCDSGLAHARHPASLLTDVNNPSRPTCWMSEPFEPGSPGERNVSLQLSLGKRFELTYVSLQFCGASKPDSLAIYKSSDYGASWQPFQFYSTDCRGTYGMPTRSAGHISVEHEHEPLCSDPNGDANSQTPNRIAFSTLEGRPSAYEFDRSALLQDWVTATDIRIEFRRLHDPRQPLTSFHHSAGDELVATWPPKEMQGEISGSDGNEESSLEHNVEENELLFDSEDFYDEVTGGNDDDRLHRNRQVGNRSATAGADHHVITGAIDGIAPHKRTSQVWLSQPRRDGQRRSRGARKPRQSPVEARQPAPASRQLPQSHRQQLQHKQQQQQNRPQTQVVNVVADSQTRGHYNFYSLADLAVGGRCKCNGHASRCVNRRQHQHGQLRRQRRRRRHDEPNGSDTNGSDVAGDAYPASQHRHKRPRSPPSAITLRAHRRRSGRAAAWPSSSSSSAASASMFRDESGASGVDDGSDVADLECECRHHTAGRDCERCAPFYFDRPWARATADNANECKPCQCHDHSSECRFSMDQYRRSEFRSGGVCINCRHNTAGVNCHLCREGYYRDPKLPITHPRTCKACRCNTAGSLHTNCDPVTGQCPCLQGVTGRECSRCLSGYLFRRELGGCIRAPVKRRLNEFGSMAADSPKLRVTVEDPDNGDYPSQHADEGGVVETHGRRRRPHYAEQCDPCKKGTKKMSFSKFCRKGYAVSVTLTDRERFGHWLRYTIELREVFKAGGERAQPGTISSLWVPRDDLRCRCPTLRLRRSYIVMGSNQMHAGKMSMTADRHSVVVDATAANLRHARGYRDQVEHCSDDR